MEREQNLARVNAKWLDVSGRRRRRLLGWKDRGGVVKEATEVEPRECQRQMMDGLTFEPAASSLSSSVPSFLPSFLHLKHPCLWSSWLRPGHVFVDVWQCSRGMFPVLLVEFGRRLTARSEWRWRGWTLRLLSDFVSSLTAWSIYQLSQWGWRMRPRLSGAAFFPPSVSPPVTSMDLLMKGSFSVSSPQLRFLSFRNHLEITHC